MGSMKDQAGTAQYDPRYLARQTDPSTSKAAAAKVVNRITEIQAQVLDVFDQHPDGLCDFDLEEIMGDHGSTYRTRRAELVERGLLRDAGRKTERAGRKRVVWVRTEKAR